MLLALVALLIYLPPVQDAIRGKAVGILREKLGTPVEIGRIALRYPLGVSISGVYVPEQNGDTLLYAGALKTQVSVIALMHKQIRLGSVDLEGLRANVRQAADSTFNFDYIIQALQGDTTAKPGSDTTGGGWGFSIGTVRLADIDLHLDLKPSQLQLALGLTSLEVDFDAFDPAAMQFHVESLALAGVRADMRMASGPPTPDTYPQLENPMAGLDLAFGTIELEHIVFTMADVAKGDSLWLEIPKGEIVAKEMDLSRQFVQLKRIELKRPVFGTLAAQRTKTDTVQAQQAPPWLDQHDGFRYFVRDWDVAVGKVDIDGGNVAMHTGAVRPPAKLGDPDHLVLGNLLVRVKKLVANNQQVSAEELRAALTTGPDTLGVDLRLHVDARPDSMVVQGGRLKLAGNTVRFSASAMPTALAAFYSAPGQVPMQAEVESKLDPRRVRPLLARLGAAHYLPTGMDERLTVHVVAKGRMEQLDSLVATLNGDQGSVVDLRGAMAGLDQWPRSTFDVQLHQLALGTGIRQLVQAFVPPGTVVPGRLNASGHATGRNGNMQVTLNVASDLGNIKADAHANGWQGKWPNDLAADLRLDRLQLGKLAGDTALGTASLRLTAEAAGLNSSARRGQLELRPSELRFMHQDLSSLHLTGRLEGDSLFAKLVTDAKDLKLALDAQGRWPGEKDSLLLHAQLQLKAVHLQGLGITQWPLDLHGGLKADLAMDTASTGKAVLNADGLRLSNPGKTYVFRRFEAEARWTGDTTALELDSDGLVAHFRTNMAADSIMPRTKAKMASYFKLDTTFVPTPNKRMEMALMLPNTDWLTGLVLPKLQSLSLKEFSGTYNSNDDQLAFAMDLPELIYDSIHVHGVGATVQAKGTDLGAALHVREVRRDSLAITGIGLEAKAERGKLETSLHIQDGEQPHRYNVVAEFEGEGSGERSLHLQPEGMVLDGKPWKADPANLLHFTPQGLVAEHFRLSSEEQRLQVSTTGASTRIGLEQFRMGNLLNIVTFGDSLPFAEGLINGSVDLPAKSGGKLTADLALSRLRLMGEQVGDLELKAAEGNNGQYSATAKLKNGPNTLDAQADVATAGGSTVSGKASIDFGDLSLFQPFAKQALYALSGKLNGNVAFELRDNRADLNGELNFPQADIGVQATRSFFHLSNQRISFNGDGIRLDRFTLQDSAGNAFRLTGLVGTKNLADPALQLALQADAFELTNSVAGDNDLFYGRTVAGLDLAINGTVSAPRVEGSVSIMDGTNFSVILPGSKVEMVSHEGIVVFTDGSMPPDTADVATTGVALKDSLQAQLRGLELDLRVQVDKNAQFHIVLDPTTGDQASVRGSADLHFTYNANGDMSLSGPFTAEEGGYTLEFYGLVKKRFDLVKGSTITWSGNPLDARLDIKAQYTAMAASYGLVAGSTSLSQEQSNRLQQRLPFEVIINVQGFMDRPDIDFGIDLPREYRNSYPQVSNELDQLAQASNLDERNRQVFGLLVTNAFIPPENAAAAPSGGLVSTAARNSVNGMLTDQLNKLTGQYVKGVDISLGVNTVEQAEGNGTYERTSVDYKVSKSFMNDRLSFEVGGSVGVDEQDNTPGNVSNNRSTQYTVYYDLTPDGRYRLRGFYEDAFELYDGEITKSGVAIQYTKDFEENSRARDEMRKEAAKRREEQEAEQRKKREERYASPNDQEKPASTP